jgi:hypothetical protein
MCSSRAPVDDRRSFGRRDDKSRSLIGQSTNDSPGMLLLLKNRRILANFWQKKAAARRSMRGGQRIDHLSRQ